MTLVVIVFLINDENQLVIKNVIIGLFEAMKVISQALAITLTKLLVHMG
jgi:hypothetical protein